MKALGQFKRLFLLYAQKRMTANFPDYFKIVLIFRMVADFPDDFKTVWIFQMFQTFQKLRKTGFFGPQTPFSYISALIGPFYGPFGPFLTFFDTQTPFLALLG